MIIRTEELKDVCTKILAAVESNQLSQITETLELKTEGTCLYISVTNREYYARVRLDIGEEIPFHASVNANLFLKLVSQITTECIELICKDNSLVVKGNGTYNIPYIFDGGKMLDLPEIHINNVTSEFELDSSILSSILLYNSKQLNMGTAAKPVQKMYYVDNEGCITFTTGACVNSFRLPQKIKILLNNRLVKLFKLFKGDKVKFSLGYDAISDDIIQTKVRFESNDITLTAILSCDDTMLNSVPVSAIRNRVNSMYPHGVTLNRECILQAINRLLLFSSGYGTKEDIKPYSEFEFGPESVIIYDANKENKETLDYTNASSGIQDKYVACLDLADLKATLEGCSDEYITLSFGDGAAFVLLRNNIYNVIPEIH